MAKPHLITRGGLADTRWVLSSMCHIFLSYSSIIMMKDAESFCVGPASCQFWALACRLRQVAPPQAQMTWFMFQLRGEGQSRGWHGLHSIEGPKSSPEF
jgi:hypothetical protein